jgi:hypothetical protein
VNSPADSPADDSGLRTKGPPAPPRKGSATCANAGGTTRVFELAEAYLPPLGCFAAAPRTKTTRASVVAEYRVRRINFFMLAVTSSPSPRSRASE